ncbi:hypothetical protein DIPPA_27544 [Diplonema papillatum]|nr:hypothetical protein DIPPA_27544 [Diplonema papillatum]
MSLGVEARESDFVDLSKATQLHLHYDDATRSVQCSAFVPEECKKAGGSACTWSCADAPFQLKAGIFKGAPLALTASTNAPAGGGLADDAVQRAYSVPLLKSGVQKAVRRRKSDAALALAAQLIGQGKDGLEEFARRVTVIMVEDSIPHPELTGPAIWCMVALARGYDGITRGLCETLLTLTWQLAEVKGRIRLQHDHAAGDSDGEDAGEPRPKPEHAKKGNLPLLSVFMAVRRAFGGMGGDMAMFDDASAFFADAGGPAVSWCRQRYAETPALPPAVSARISGFAAALCGPGRGAAAPIQLGPAEKVAEAVDFHCCRFLVKRVVDKAHEQGLPFLDDEFLTALWWRFRSGVYADEKRLFSFNLSPSSHPRISPAPPDRDARDENYWVLVEPTLNEVLREVAPWELPPFTPNPQGNPSQSQSRGPPGFTQPPSVPSGSPPKKRKLHSVGLVSIADAFQRVSKMQKPAGISREAPPVGGCGSGAAPGARQCEVIVLE